jgi:hypothetical protein
VKNIFRHLKWNRNFRRFIAAAFLLFLLAEWGGHSAAFAHSYAGKGQSVSSDSGKDDDLCKTLVRCNDGPRREVPAPSFGHQLSQHNALFDHLSDSNLWGTAIEDPIPRHQKIAGVTRPPDPLFHPPELS